MKIEIYTDGACSKNGSKDAIGGWAWVLLEDGERKFQDSGRYEGATNNIVELLAIIEALKFVKDTIKPGLFSQITIYSDSSYCIKGITEWIHNWRKNGFWRDKQKTQELKNRELWMELDKLDFHFNIEWKWVKGHAGNEWNEYVDKLAKEAI